MMTNSKFKIQNSKFTKGFTLVELLIVVTIIGILASFLTANFITIRQRARDGLRKSDLRSIQSALEIYRADAGTYLQDTSSKRLNSTACPDSNALTSGSNTYMQKIPCEPQGITSYNSGNYFYYSNGQTYTLATCLENTDDQQGTAGIEGDLYYLASCESGKYYVVNNP